MDLAIQSDLETDSVYIALSKRALRRGAVANSRRVDPDIVLDFDHRGRLIGVDVMNASKRIGRTAHRVRIDELVGVKEAAAVTGVRSPNFVRDYASRPDFPSPVATVATGRLWLRSHVQEYANSRPRRARRAS